MESEKGRNPLFRHAEKEAKTNVDRTRPHFL